MTEIPDIHEYLSNRVLRDAEESGDVHEETVVIRSFESMNTASPTLTRDICHNGGDDILEVWLSFTPKAERDTHTDLSMSSQATKTADYTATQDDRYIFADATAGVVTITLPIEACKSIHTVVKTDASNNVVVNNDAGSAEQTLTTAGASTTQISDGTSWYEIAN